MLQNTFIHIPGIGHKTEQDLWDSGITCWEQAAEAPLGSLRFLEGEKGSRIRDYASRSIRALEQKNAGFFSRLGKIGESWRAFPEFEGECAFLDIETTGLSHVFDRITLVGLYDSQGYQVFIDGHNLEDLPERLSRYSAVVTFNGSIFDLNFLRLAFPSCSLPKIQIDLRFVSRRLGLTGGLKAIEQTLGIRRSRETASLSGFDAVVLWSRYLRGDKGALELLIRYNEEDVLNLRKIMEIVYSRLAEQTAPFLKEFAKSSNGSNGHQSHNGKSKDLAGRFMPQTAAARDRVPSLLRKTALKHPRIVGIDLTGSKKRASGWALMDGSKAETKLLKTDAEIIRETVAARPDLVSIDSPLSLPAYKHRDNAGHMRLPIYRQCEIGLRKMGISVFWCLLPSMRSLTFRGIRLAKKLRQHGLKVIESYPGAAQDILLIPRKKTSLEELKWGLHRAGIDGEYIRSKVSHDEVDAITSALVGLFYLADEYLPLGNAKEDYLIVPKSPFINTSKFYEVLTSLHLDVPKSV